MSEMKPNEMKCPLKFGGPSSFAQDWTCDAERCAWWCEWIKRCALTAIVSEASNQLDVIRRGLGQ